MKERFTYISGEVNVGDPISEVRDDEIGCWMQLTAGGRRLWDVLGPRCITVDRLTGIRILAKL